MNILGVCGSTHQDSHSLMLLQEILKPLQSENIQVDILNLVVTPLPLFRVDKQYDPKEADFIQQVRQLSGQADAFILVSPEYHGSMTGWMKNFLDFHYREFAGKLFAIAVTTGGSQGISCLTHMRASVQYCHGWTLPYQAAASEQDFDASGALNNPKIQDRLQKMGRDLLVYGRLVKTQFDSDRNVTIKEDQNSNLGFAGWYR